MESCLIENKPPKAGLLGRFGILFSNPLKLFGELTEKPDFIWPVIFLTLITIFSIPVAKFQLNLLSESKPELTNNLNNFSINVIIAYSTVNTLFRVLFLWFIQTGIYTIYAKILKNGFVSFKSLLSINGYILITSALSYIFQGSLVMTTGILPMVGLESLINSEGRSTIFQIVLRSINPFTIGGLILTVFALIKVLKMSRFQAIAITFIVWVIGLGMRYIGL